MFWAYIAIVFILCIAFVFFIVKMSAKVEVQDDISHLDINMRLHDETNAY